VGSYEVIYISSGALKRSFSDVINLCAATPRFKFLSGGLDNVTFKEFVHGSGLYKLNLVDPSLFNNP
jgi:hypothetical protein